MKLPVIDKITLTTSGREIETDLNSLRRLLLGRALDAAQAEAARSGASKLSVDEINAEIKAMRQEREQARVAKS